MWFEYEQNNSGGYYDGPAIFVYVWAKNADEANSIAEDNDLYFDGVCEGFDCECCGDRWYRAYESRVCYKEYFPLLKMIEEGNPPDEIALKGVDYRWYRHCDIPLLAIVKDENTYLYRIADHEDKLKQVKE